MTHRTFTIEIGSFIGTCCLRKPNGSLTSAALSFHFWVFHNIFRRTNSDLLELSEISLDLNLVNNNVRYKFTDSPILAVSIAEVNENLIVLVATISSVHQLKYSTPNQIHKTIDETQSFSVFHEASMQTQRDPSASLFYVIGHAATPSKYKITKYRDGSRGFLFIESLLRSSNTTYGRMCIERGWQRGIFRARLSKQPDAVHDELLQWADHNG